MADDRDKAIGFLVKDVCNDAVPQLIIVDNVLRRVEHAGLVNSSLAKDARNIGIAMMEDDLLTEPGIMNHYRRDKAGLVVRLKEFAGALDDIARFLVEAGQDGTPDGKEAVIACLRLRTAMAGAPEADRYVGYPESTREQLEPYQRERSELFRRFHPKGSLVELIESGSPHATASSRDPDDVVKSRIGAIFADQVSRAVAAMGLIEGILDRGEMNVAGFFPKLEKLAALTEDRFFSEDGMSGYYGVNKGGMAAKLEGIGRTLDDVTRALLLGAEPTDDAKKAVAAFRDLRYALAGPPPPEYAETFPEQVRRGLRAALEMMAEKSMHLHPEGSLVDLINSSRERLM